MLQAIVDRHDVLRLRAERDDDGEWIVRFPPRGAVTTDSCLTRVDVAGMDEGARQEKILALVHDTAARLDPRTGAMVHALWFADERGGDLLVAFHGLVTDVTSLAILRVDLEAALGQLARAAHPCSNRAQRRSARGRSTWPSERSRRT